MERWDIYEINDYFAFARIEEIYKPWTYWYSDKKKELWLKTNSIIIKYRKSTDKNFTVWMINYMKLIDFKRNYTLTK